MLNIDKLQKIKEMIESMNQCYQLEILKLLIKEDSVIISENNNGTFINLSNLDIITISKLENFIEYVKKQLNQLSYIENEKVNIKNEFFNQKTEKNNQKKTTNINQILDAKWFFFTIY